MSIRPWLFFLVLLSVVGPLVADGPGEYEGHEREGFFGRLFGGEEHEREFETSYIRAVSDPTYATECGACHFAYQAELLPSKSWVRVLEGLADHFGEDATLAADQLAKVRAYLMAHSAETSHSSRARQFYSSANGQAPLRITELPYFKQEHHEISAEVITHTAVKSWSNCAACHTKAADGIFSEEYVRIPQ